MNWTIISDFGEYLILVKRTMSYYLYWDLKKLPEIRRKLVQTKKFILGVICFANEIYEYVNVNGERLQYNSCEFLWHQLYDMALAQQIGTTCRIVGATM